MNEAHSPLPWVKSTLCETAIATPSKTTVWHHGSGLKTEHPLSIIEFPSKEISEDEAKANRDFVLRCVNTHAALVEALKGLVEVFNGEHITSLDAALEAADKALRQAEEGK